MPKIPKILHIITTIESGGAENQLLILINEQIKHGHVISCLPLKGLPELDQKLLDIGVDLITAPRGMTFLRQIFYTRKMLRNKSFVIHCHLPRAEVLGFLVKNRDSKLILTRHNSESFFPRIDFRLASMLSRLVVQKADEIVFISNSVLNFCETHKEITSESNKNIVYYGYKRLKNDFEDKELPHIEQIKYWKSSGMKIIGTIARLEKQKDLETFLRAAKLLMKRDRNIRFIIVGKGSLQNELKNLAHNLGLSDLIMFYGRTSASVKLIELFDVFVLSSKYEGFGMVLLEAMDAKVPIVAANNSSIPEVLGNSYPSLFKTGNVNELTDKIEFLLNNSEFKVKILQILQERMKKFSSLRMERQMDEIYEKALAK